MPKRKRLSKKQRWLLNEVFVANYPVTDALHNLRIRPGTLQRWLTDPFFLEKLQTHISQFYLEARMELARCTPRAISGLSFLSEKSLRHKEVRNACNDLLKFHTHLAKNTAGKKQAQDGVCLDNLGTLWEQFGVLLDNNGALLDKDGNKKTPQNHLLDTNNPENTKKPCLIPSKPPAP